MVLKKKNESILLFLLLSILISACFLLHGAWPFGTLTIEGDDGYRQHIPEMYYLWDMLHGKKGLFFDWYTALGANPVGAMLHFGVFSPLNIVYLFIPRSAVLYSTSVLAMLRLVLLGFSFRYMLRRLLTPETPSLFVMLLSVLYSCNSWTFHYMYFFQWIDTAILLPILITKLYRVIEDGRELMSFTILLALSFMICIQQDYMLVIFLILFSGMLIFCRKTDAKERRAAILRFGLCGLTAFFMSAVLLLPAVSQFGASSRMDGSLLFKIKEMFRSNAAPDHSYDSEKYLLSFTVFNVSVFSLLLLLLQIFRRKFRFDRESFGLFLMWLLLLIPVFAESCHYLWQGGVYLCFPLRGGYMLSCISLLLSGKMLSSFSWKRLLSSRLTFILLLLPFCVLMVMLGKQRMYRAELGLHKDKQDLYRRENLLYEDFAGTLPEERFLSKENVLTENYPLVAGTASAENWIHIVPASLPAGWYRLGYYHAGSAIYGNGGTYLSDALLGTRYTFWKNAPDARLYENIIERDAYYLAESRLRLPFGVLLSSENSEGTGPLDAQAFLFHELFGPEEMDILNIHADEELQLCFNEDRLLYIENTGYETGGLSVNGEEYTAAAARLSFLGIRKGEISIRTGYDTRIGSIPLEALFSKGSPDAVSGLEMSGHSLCCDVANDKKNSILFLPIIDQKGWECRINGAAAEHIPLFDGFVGIRLPETGNVKVELIYHPPLLTAGILLSICGIVLLLCEKRFGLSDRLSKLRLSAICPWIFYAILFGIVFAGYLCNLLLLILPDSWWWWLLKPKT